MLVVLDIDGTLSNNEHREHHRKKSPPDFETYFRPDLVFKDSPIPEAQRVVAKMQDLRFELVCLTGRNETLRDVTGRWLLEHFNIDAGDNNLIMRPLGNMRPHQEYKAEAMQNLLAEYKSRGERSFIFVDNDSRVFDIYGAEGLVLHAPHCWATMFRVFAEPEVTHD